MDDFKTMGDMVAPVFGVGKVFEPTNNFRFMKRMTCVINGECFVKPSPVRILQQAWICRNTGEVDWRDVPEVSEE